MARRFPSSHAPLPWARFALVFAASIVPLGTAAAIQPGCGSITAITPTPDACEVTITTDIPLETVTHEDVCTDLDYPTNPPSGGPHWGTWAAFGSYDAPVPREAYVHSMEHGAVILLHDCEGSCPEVIAALEDARNEVTGDPKCLQIPDGPTERVIITPDPELDVPLAAAAWGATYRATCIDLASLRDFVKKRYDHGPESTCAQGKVFGDPDAGAPDCDAGPPDADAGSGGAGGTAGAGGTGAPGGADGG
jgi:hypothetical protein